MCDKYGSDKGSTSLKSEAYPWAPHTYADFLDQRFMPFRDNIKHVFECGIGTNNPGLISTMTENGKPGASLRVWRDYFTNAEIYGADIDENILFEEERIKTFHVDQTSKSSIEAMWAKINKTGFDLMIDDGLHTVKAGITLFEHSIAKLADAGQYIIEDVYLSQLLEYKKYFKGKPFLVEYISLDRPNANNYDNGLVVIRHRTS